MVEQWICSCWYQSKWFFLINNSGRNIEFRVKLTYALNIVPRGIQMKIKQIKLSYNFKVSLCKRYVRRMLSICEKHF